MSLMLILLTSLIQPCTAPTNILKIEPPTVILTPGVNDTTGGHVTITCQPPNVSIDYLYIIMITWKPSFPALGGISGWIAQANVGNGTGKAYLRKPSPGVTVNGSLAEKIVVVNFLSAACPESGRYKCHTIYRDHTDSSVPTKPTQNLSMEVTPGQLRVTASPPGKTSWTVNDTLNLTCHGPVGTVSPNTSVEFVWEYREKSTGIWSPFVWSPYDGNSWDLEAGPSSSQDCYEKRSSILLRRITRRDHRRQYRCYVLRNNRSYEEFATAHYVGTVVGVDDGVQPDGNNGAGKTTAKSIGIAVTAAVAGLVIVSIVIVVLVAMKRRQRQRMAKNRASWRRGSRHQSEELALEDTTQTTEDSSSMARGQPMSSMSATSSHPASSTAKSYSDISSVSTSQGHSSMPS